MGLFDLFKKKTTSDQNAVKPVENTAIDKNVYLLDALKQKLIEMGYKTDRHPKYLSLNVNDELEIALAVIDDPNNHPSIFYARILTMHSIHFSQGIDEHVVGYGSTLEEQTTSLINNYIESVFSTIIEGLSDTHDPNLDLNILTNGIDVLWHPTLGSMCFYGQWNEYPPNEYLFELLKDIIPTELTPKKFNWLKIYSAKIVDESVIVDCIFNNEQWDEGFARISADAKQRRIDGDLKAVKQFIIFRRCDLYDQYFSLD